MVNIKKVTMIMTTYNNWDFTSACCRVFRNYYPDVRIILADGGSTDNTTKNWTQVANDFVYIENGKIEDCRNAAAVLVDTPYLLTMDNDVKIIGKEALPLLVETLDKFPDAAETGAYCVKVVDYFGKKGYCSRQFTDHMQASWCPAYFTLHRTWMWRKVYGQPKRYYYGDPPFERGEKEKRYNNGGDACISYEYEQNNFSIITPRKEVPVLHFVGAAWWSTDMKTSKWWADEHTHIPINPLNDWEKYEKD